MHGQVLSLGLLNCNQYPAMNCWFLWGGRGRQEALINASYWPGLVLHLVFHSIS